MAFTITHSLNDGQQFSSIETVPGGSTPRIDEDIPAPSTDLPLAFAFAVAKLNGIWMQSPRAMTICTNAASSGAPQETIVLAANVAFIWTRASGAPVPFAGNVTGLFITLAAGEAARLTIRAAIDPT